MSALPAMLLDEPDQDVTHERLAGCEGALILHRDGWVECTDPQCVELLFALHAWTLECDTLWDRCPCAPTEASQAV